MERVSERVSAQYWFHTPLSKYLTVIVMTLNYVDSRSSKVNGNDANRKPMGGFLSDLESNMVSLTVFEIFDIKDIFP